MHGLLADYPFVLIVGTPPSSPGFRDRRSPARWCFLLAEIILLTSLVKRAEWELLRVFPNRLNLDGVVVVGLFTLLSAFLFGFAHTPVPRHALIVFGLFGIMVGALSQTDEMPAQQSDPVR